MTHSKIAGTTLIWCEETQDAETHAGHVAAPESEEMILSCGGCGEVEPEIGPETE